jgi:type VI secretion system protein ImpA
MTSQSLSYQGFPEWIDDLSADFPCGPDLEYDPAFRQLEEAVNGRPEAEYGPTVVAAVPPDWTLADTLCVDLLARTRDLRIVAQFSRARLANEGVIGLANGLALTGDLIERQWEHVHPQLDASDANDPTARINALAAFVDTRGVVADLLDTPLLPRLASQSMALTLREWLYATGEVATPGSRAVMSAAEIEAAVAAATNEAMALKTVLSVALTSAERVETALALRVEATQALDLGSLKALLRRAEALVGDCLAKLGVNADATAATPAAIEGVPLVNDAAPKGDRIVTRADVVATLDRLCNYYSTHEPSSPVPLLLVRARGLVEKSFVDLMKDLAPEGLAQLTNVIGATGIPQSID